MSITLGDHLDEIDPSSKEDIWTKMDDLLIMFDESALYRAYRSIKDTSEGQTIIQDCQDTFDGEIDDFILLVVKTYFVETIYNTDLKT